MMAFVLDFRKMINGHLIGLFSACIFILLAGCGGFSSSGDIHRAASEGNIAKVKSLLSKGALPDGSPSARQNMGGVTPLHEAAYCGRYDVAVLLMEHGADPEARDNLSQSALDYASETIGAKRKCSPSATVDKQAVISLFSSADEISRMRTAGLDRVALDKATASRSPSALRDFIAWHGDSALRPEAEAALAGLQERAWQKGRRSMEALRGLLREYPASSHRQEALAQMARLAGPDKVKLQTLSAEFNDIIEHIPIARRVGLIGPAGLTVEDISLMLRRGVSEQLVVNRIEASGCRYRVFSAEESALLGQMGITEPVQDAMLKSTRKAAEPSQSSALVAEIGTLRGRLGAMMAQMMAQNSPANEATALAANCSARLAAMEACRDLTEGAPRQNTCMGAAKTQFPCSGGLRPAQTH